MKNDMKAVKNAQERGMELMSVPMSKLPAEATAYARDLSRRVGWCMEVALTAWCTYAHLGEGLPLGPDELYHPPPDEVERYRALKAVAGGE